MLFLVKAMRTFIFGAGASVHAGYPLATDLWRVMERWARATFPEGHSFRDAVDTMNAEFNLSKPFELVLTDLEKRLGPLLKARLTKSADIAEKHRLLNLRDGVKSLIHFYFDSLRSWPAQLYEIFAVDVLERGDTVITFNYDLAVDRALKLSGKWTAGNGYGFEIPRVFFEDSPCKLLKLHGSTSWRGELFHGNLPFSQVSGSELSLGQSPVVDSSELEYLGYRCDSDARGHSPRPNIEALIMPTADKKFFNETSFGREWEGFWDSLWHRAGEALRISNEVYVIGYSIPEYDTRARTLLTAKTNKNAKVRVCCHDGTTTVVEALKQVMLPRNIEVQRACASTFESWISCMKHGTVAKAHSVS